MKPIYGNIPEKEEEVKIKYKHNVIKGELLPEEDLELEFSEPVSSIESGMIHFYDIDSNEVQIDPVILDLRKATFKTFGSGAERIVIDSAAVKTFYGHSVNEKIELTFANHEKDYYGSLIITMDTVFSNPVIVHLLNDKAELIQSIPFL